MRIRGFRHPLLPRRREQNDLGFGTQITDPDHRLLNKDGSLNIKRQGYRSWHPYQDLIEMPWPRFFLVVMLFYFGVNLVYGLCFYWIGIENLPGSSPGEPWENFAQSFFFSVQTFTTVGYGTISPKGALANILASFDALTGLMFLALATGLFFAKFSQPIAQILFSDKAIITPYNDLLSFQFRIANSREHKIIETEAQVTMTWIEDVQGIKRRRFANLPLERSKIFLFPLNWNVVHPIDEKSPLFGKSIEDLKEIRAEFLVLIKGYDETFAQMVHANSSYTWEEIERDVRFKTMYSSDPMRGTTLYLDQINDLVPIESEK